MPHRKGWPVFLLIATAASGCGGSDTATYTPTPAATTVMAQPSSSPTPPAATYSQVNQQIFQPLCVSCHYTGGQLPNLTNYAAFATDTQYVVPGNASLSLIYTITASGQMPKGGPPLTTTQQQMLGSWINAGALSN